MNWVVPLSLVALAISMLVVFSRLQMGKRQRVLARRPRTVDIAILVHDINDDRCTGCDACVAVCPTNVLDLVDNKSRVLRFEDCIQCEACMWVCPTEALVMHPINSEPPPLRVPEVDQAYQTRVSGQYLIGEVAGKPLVKNAANIGRAVVEHMKLGGLLPRKDVTDRQVDVVIIGSGPGGLSTALTCLHHGYSYVVLEKEQQIASTIARYPKGKLVMAEPYDVANLSFLPVFDSNKEELVPLWSNLLRELKVKVHTGALVERAQRLGRDFSIATSVGPFTAQRVVIASGTRGKPRMLGAPGESLPKVQSLLDDPDLYRGKPVLVVGGGDSAVEAAVALADAGAAVLVSYRGNSFHRAQQRNRQAIENYLAQGKVTAKFQTEVVKFSEDSVALKKASGEPRKYPNQAAFVLIGSEPPAAWLEKMGVQFVERPHQYALRATDALVRQLAPQAIECPERVEAAIAALGIKAVAQPISDQRAAKPRAGSLGLAAKGVARAASQLLQRVTTHLPARRQDGSDTQGPQTADRTRSSRRAGTFGRRLATHSGDGRRDDLSPEERVRFFRGLRDDGAKIADVESIVGFFPKEVESTGAEPLWDLEFEEKSKAAAVRILPQVAHNEFEEDDRTRLSPESVILKHGERPAPTADRSAPRANSLSEVDWDLE